jgi:hypothetical protein
VRPLNLCLSAILLAASSAGAVDLFPPSDGSDGAFHPTTHVTLDLPDDGVFNFTSIDIPAGVTVRFHRNDANTPVYLRATGAVAIAGVIDVSAGGVSLADLGNPALGYIRPATTDQGGPGGGTGGLSGLGDTTCDGADCRDAAGGTGPSGGLPGVTPTHSGLKVFGEAGGGGGMATPGGTALAYTTGAPGAPDVPLPVPLEGGSGGGGGSGWYFFGVQLEGGSGGGGGGALHIDTPDTITVGGSLLALGANGGWAFANSGGQGGPGGGGSGGNIALVAGGSVTLLPSARVDASGGFGGGLGTQTYAFDPRAYENGARGGTGYLFVEGSHLALDGTLNATVVAVPEPETWALMVGGLGMVVFAGRRRTWHRAEARRNLHRSATVAGVLRNTCPRAGRASRRTTRYVGPRAGATRIRQALSCAGARPIVRPTPPRCAPRASGSCPSSSALPPSGPTARSRPRR